MENCDWQNTNDAKCNVSCLTNRDEIVLNFGINMHIIDLLIWHSPKMRIFCCWYDQITMKASFNAALALSFWRNAYRRSAVYAERDLFFSCWPTEREEFWSTKRTTHRSWSRSCSRWATSYRPKPTLPFDPPPILSYSSHRIILKYLLLYPRTSVCGSRDITHT